MAFPVNQDRVDWLASLDQWDHWDNPGHQDPPDQAIVLVLMTWKVLAWEWPMGFLEPEGQRGIRVLLASLAYQASLVSLVFLVRREVKDHREAMADQGWTVSLDLMDKRGTEEKEVKLVAMETDSLDHQAHLAHQDKSSTRPPAVMMVSLEAPGPRAKLDSLARLDLRVTWEIQANPVMESRARRASLAQSLGLMGILCTWEDCRVRRATEDLPDPSGLLGSMVLLG